MKAKLPTMLAIFGVLFIAAMSGCQDNSEVKRMKQELAEIQKQKQVE